jgi:hypothetical protein
MISFIKLTKAEFQSIEFINISIARYFLEDLKTKAKLQEDRTYSKFTSDFNKFKIVGMILNDNDKT